MARSLREQLAVGRRFGRKGIRHDPRTLQFRKYFRPAELPPIPDTVDHVSKVSEWGMLGNDSKGDCVMAALAHALLDFTTYAGATPYCPTEQQVIDEYLVLSPGDNGLVILDTLNLMKQQGFWGHKIDAFVQLSAGDTNELEAATFVAVAVIEGLSLPDQNTFGPWTTVTGPPDFNNGHCILVPGTQRSAGMSRSVSWGQVMPQSYPWYRKYAGPEGQGEAYALLSKDYMTAQGLNPEGIAWDEVFGDLEEIANGGTPQPPPPPPPPPPGPGGCGKLIHRAVPTWLVRELAQAKGFRV